MTTLAKAAAAAPKIASSVVVLPPSAFVATWSKRPAGDVAVGLRTLSDQELLVTKSEAAKEAVAGGREGAVAEDRYHDVLMIWAVGFAATNPNDVTKPYFEFRDETVRVALTPEAIRRLWDELELLHVAQSPLRPLATDDELRALAVRLAQPGALGRLSPAKALRWRRWARFLLDELPALPPPSA